MITITRYPALHGQAYIDALSRVEAVPKYLVDDLVAEDAILMLSSDGSVGKSTISINAAAAMSAGTPVWGQFRCVRPLRVYYVISERTATEALRRLRRMQGICPANPENIWISDCFAGTCNLLLDGDADSLIQRIQEDAPDGIDILVLDPLYPLVAGALSEDRVGNILCRQLVRIKRTLRCVLWLCHHNVKLRLTDDGKLGRPPNAMFGSVWLYNLLTLQLAAIKETATQTVLHNQKDNWSCAPKSVTLVYQADTETVATPDDMGPMRKGERVNVFLRQRAADGQAFTRSDIIDATGVADSQFYRIIHSAPWAGRVINQTPNGLAASYIISNALPAVPAK